MMKSKTHQLLPLVISVLLLLLSCDFPFFWDTIQLGYRQAMHLYTGGGWLLPDEIDSGHPPGFGAYLAAWWSVLGRKLWVSHLAMLPWICLLLGQLAGICRHLVGKYWWLAFGLCTVDAVLLGQLLMVSPDVPLVALYLGGFNLIIFGQRPKAQRTLLLAGISLGLALVSTRGWVAALSLFILDWIIGFSHLPEGNGRSFGKVLRLSWRKVLPFLPGGILALAYLVLHYQAKGWISFHPNSPWAASFHSVGLKGVLRNIGLVGWRFLDVGRLFGWLLLAWTLYRMGLKKLWRLPYFRHLTLGITLFLAILLPLILTRTGLTGPRYLLPAIVLFDLLVAYSILGPAGRGKRWSRLLFALAFVCLLAGNFLVYPQRIAQAWDATPLHVIYFGQLRATEEYLADNHIPLDTVGTVFPSIGPRAWRECNDEFRGFKRADMDQDQYLFISNIHNDWTDEQLDQIEQSKRAKVIFEQVHPLGVWSRVYFINRAKTN